MAGGGAVVSVAEFNEMKSSMAQLVNLAQLQANSVQYPKSVLSTILLIFQAFV
jgi:hypothetical protein